MNRPRVTVLMAVYNGAAYLERAVASILGQTFRDLELLVVDDGSTDASPDVLRACADSRLRVIRHASNLGLTRSLNHGLAEARGALVARQDADDVSHPSRLEAQVAFLERRPEVVVLGAQARMVDAGGRAVRVAPWPKSTSNDAIRWQIIFDSPFVHSTVVFRHSVIWSSLGGYDEAFTTSQDYALWSRVAAAGHAMANLPDVHLDFRLHDASVSSTYRRDSVARLHGVLRGSLVSELGEDALPADWPNLWIRVNNPRAFPEASDSPAVVADAILAIHRRFVARYPEAGRHPEIRRHLASMLVRVATAGAEQGWLASASPFARAWRLAPGMSAQASPRYAARLLLAPWRRRGGARADSRAH